MVSGKIEPNKPPLPLLNQGGELRLRHALLLVLLFFAFSSWFMQVSDVDFWWHIATGRYILEHRSLPDKDPLYLHFP